MGALKIDRVLIGEALVGDGNEVAHIDLLLISTCSWVPGAALPRPRFATRSPIKSGVITRFLPWSLPT